MTIESIIQIICAIASVIIAVVAIIISIIQFKKTSHVQKLIDKRDIDRYNENVNIEARKFITKYNETDEIQLLALCLVADFYNDVHPYNRKIYKEWCSLSNDVKKEILKLRKFDISYDIFFNKENFFDLSLKQLKKVLTDNYDESLYERLFYDSAKYYLRSINVYKKIKVSNVNIVIGNKKSILKTNVNVRLWDIITDILCKKEIKYDIVTNEGKKEMFNSLKKNVINYFQNVEETSACYICCLVALYGIIYSFANSNLKFDNYGFIDDYASKEDWKLEDLFLYSLLVINMYQEKNFVKE